MVFISVSLHALTFIGSAAAAAGNGKIEHTKLLSSTTETIGACRFITFSPLELIALADQVQDKEPIDVLLG